MPLADWECPVLIRVDCFSKGLPVAFSYFAAVPILTCLLSPAFFRIFLRYRLHNFGKHAIIGLRG